MRENTAGQALVLYIVSLDSNPDTPFSPLKPLQK